MAVQISFTPEMIEEVIRDWERDHPGKIVDRDLTGQEFADRMMKKMEATAEIVPSGTRG